MTLMSPLFLLPLLFIGATAFDGSEFYAKSFVDVLRNAIEFKNEGYLSSSFSNSFIFIGCQKHANKRQVLEMLKSIPSNGGMKITFKSSHFNNRQNIEYVVGVNGLGLSTEASFIIENSNGSWKLLSGRVLDCLDHFLVSPADSADSAEDIAKSFMASMSSNSQNKVKLAALISDSFEFNGCVAMYDKKMAVVAFSGSASELTMNFESARFVNGDDVEYVVELIRHGISHEAQFTLHKENGVYVLFRGKILNCSSHHVRSLATETTDPGIDALAKAFIVYSVEIYKSHDRNRTADLFDDGFTFQSCIGVDSKNEVVNSMVNYREYDVVPLRMTFLSARKFTNCIEYTINVSGMFTAFHGYFYIRLIDGKYKLIEGGNVWCRKHDLVC